MKMEQKFEDYLKQERECFSKVASEYTVTEHLKLRTAIDSLLIAYDQAVNQVNKMKISKEQFTKLAKEHLIAVEGYKIDKNGNKSINVFGIEKLYEAINK